MFESNSSYWYILFWIPLYSVLWLFVLQLLQRYSKVHWFVFVIVPIVQFTIWTWFYSVDWFRYVKRCSVLIGILVINIMRYHDSAISKFIQNRMIYLWKALPIITYLVLSANILEAMLKEFILISQNPTFIFPGNVFCGLCLIVTIANPNKIWVFDNKSVSVTTNEIEISDAELNINVCKESEQYLQRMYEKYKPNNVFIYDLGIFWVITYSLWNVIFIYNVYCLYSLPATVLHVCVPLLMTLWNPIGEWIELRAYALMLDLYVYKIPYIQYIPFFHLARCEQYSPPLLSKQILSILSCLTGFSLVLYQIYCGLKSKKKHVSLQNSLIQYLISLLMRNNTRYESVNFDDSSECVNETDIEEEQCE
eukprot:521788_1